MSNRSEFTIFYKNSLDDYFNYFQRAMIQEIEGNPQNYILNVNEQQFISYLIDKFTIDTLDILFDDKSISKHEKLIPASWFPGGGIGFSVQPGKSYKKDIIRYHIPFSGNSALFDYRPNSHPLNTVDVLIIDDDICFDIINFYNDQNKIENQANFNIEILRSNITNINREVNLFNNSLKSKASISFDKRKKHLLKSNDLMFSLGIPIKKSDNVPSTFSISTPKAKKKISISPPAVFEEEFKPEPTLDSSTYQDILQIIQDVGKQFERMPSTYSDKDEESLRDHILLVLEPHFEGSATGETFNKSGKTDILLRYEGSNAFIAECKFWRGEKTYLSAINQLLSYLTWRDSKSAIVLFVKNKEFSSVIEKIQSATQNHPNFIGFSGKNDDTWLNYRFHINDDTNREIKLAVLLFHIPSD